MANWNDLLNAKLVPKKGQVFLSYGDDSALVWDSIHHLASESEYTIRVEDESDLAYQLPLPTAYILKNPKPKIVDLVAGLLKSGSSDSYFVVITSNTLPKSETMEYMKRKSQQYKLYFNITAPKSERPRENMITFFSLRWGVTRDQATRVCALLEFDPGKLYLFDQQYLLVGGDGMLSSAQSQKLLDELLGDSSQHLVASRILNRQVVDGTYDSDFNYQILSYLSATLSHMFEVQMSTFRGNVTISTIAKDTGLSQYQVLSCAGWAEDYSIQEIKKRRDMVTRAFDYYAEPELLETLSRRWQ